MTVNSNFTQPRKRRRPCFNTEFAIATLTIFWVVIGGNTNKTGVTAEDEMEKYGEAISSLYFTRSSREVRKGINQLEKLSNGKGLLAANSMAELGVLNLVGSKLPQSINKATQQLQKAAESGSLKGRHVYITLSEVLAYDLPKRGDDERRYAQLEELTAQQSYLPTMMSMGFRRYFSEGDCESALVYYRNGAALAISAVDSTYFGDYASLRNLTMGPDSLGEDAASKAARDIETFNYWSFQADRRDREAFYQLGKVYQLGNLGERRDMAKAAENFQRAGSLGHRPALSELGRLLTVGHGRDKDFHLALQHLQQGAEAGDAVASATLGSLLIQGVYSSDDTATAMRNLYSAAAMNNSDAEWELAQVRLREGRLSDALGHLQRAEFSGHVKSTMALAQLYENGLGGLTKSCATAVRMYKRVCEVGPWLDDQYGPREAIREFRNGKEESALILSLLAAAEGYEVAQFNAAWLLLKRNTGKFLSASTRFELAAELLRRLSLQNPLNVEASLLEGHLHLQGGGYRWTLTRPRHQQGYKREQEQRQGQGQGQRQGGRQSNGWANDAIDEKQDSSNNDDYDDEQDITDYDKNEVEYQDDENEEDGDRSMEHGSEIAGGDKQSRQNERGKNKNKGGKSKEVDRRQAAGASKTNKKKKTKATTGKRGGMDKARSNGGRSSNENGSRGGWVRGVPRNLSYAAECFGRAAEAGSVEGMEQLALQLMTGAGVAIDRHRAADLMRRALTAIASGRSPYRGVQAAVRVFTLRYRLIIVEVCNFFADVVSGRTLARLMPPLSSHRRDKRKLGGRQEGGGKQRPDTDTSGGDGSSGSDDDSDGAVSAPYDSDSDLPNESEENSHSVADMSTSGDSADASGASRAKHVKQQIHHHHKYQHQHQYEHQYHRQYQHHQHHVVHDELAHDGETLIGDGKSNRGISVVTRITHQTSIHIPVVKSDANADIDGGATTDIDNDSLVAAVLKDASDSGLSFSKEKKKASKSAVLSNKRGGVTAAPSRSAAGPHGSMVKGRATTTTSPSAIAPAAVAGAITVSDKSGGSDTVEAMAVITAGTLTISGSDSGSGNLAIVHDIDAHSNQQSRGDEASLAGVGGDWGTDDSDTSDDNDSDSTDNECDSTDDISETSHNSNTASDGNSDTTDDDDSDEDVARGGRDGDPGNEQIDILSDGNMATPVSDEVVEREGEGEEDAVEEEDDGEER